MDRTSAPGHVNRRFVSEDVAANRPPTELISTDFNAWQEELMAVIEAAGIAPSVENNAQVLAALNTLFTKKTGATGLIRSLTLAGGGIVREWGDVVNAATVGGIEFGFSYNANINLATGAWLGRDIAGPCFLRKLNDTGMSEEIWYSKSDAAGAVPVWTCADAIDPSGVSNGNVGGKNLIINGNFDVWQKGPGPFLNWSPVTDYGYVCDMWNAYRTGSGAGLSVSQVSGMTADTTYAAKIQRIAGDASVAAMKFDYNVPTRDLLNIQGRQVQLSFDLLKGANFSAAGGVVFVSVLFGNGTINRAANGGASWGIAGSANGQVIPINIVDRYASPGMVTIPTNATKMAISFSWIPVGVAGADDSITLGRVQLEIGKAITQFETTNKNTELTKCMRYYQSFDNTAGITNWTAPVPALYSYGAAGQNVAMFPTISVPMDKDPVLTKYGTWLFTNCSTPVLSATRNYLSMVTTVTALGAFSFNAPSAAIGYTLDARITA